MSGTIQLDCFPIVFTHTHTHCGSQLVFFYLFLDPNCSILCIYLCPIYQEKIEWRNQTIKGAQPNKYLNLICISRRPLIVIFWLVFVLQKCCRLLVWIHNNCFFNIDTLVYMCFIYLYFMFPNFILHLASMCALMMLNVALNQIIILPIHYVNEYVNVWKKLCLFNKF